MPRKRKAGKARITLPEGALKLYLRSGHDFFHELNGLEEDIPLLKRLWAQWKEEIIAEYQRTHPGQRPWAWWRFDKQFDYRPHHTEQLEYLKKHGLLTLEEKAKIEQWQTKLNVSN